MDDEQRFRLIGSRHECARMLIWVREQIGPLRERACLTPARFTRKHATIAAALAPLQTLERRMMQAHSDQGAALDKQKV